MHQIPYREPANLPNQRLNHLPCHLEEWDPLCSAQILRHLLQGQCHHRHLLEHLQLVLLQLLRLPLPLLLWRLHLLLEVLQHRGQPLLPLRLVVIQLLQANRRLVHPRQQLLLPLVSKQVHLPRHLVQHPVLHHSVKHQYLLQVPLPSVLLLQPQLHLLLVRSEGRIPGIFWWISIRSATQARLEKWISSSPSMLGKKSSCSATLPRNTALIQLCLA
mmetsp:Transcript_1453/g.4054  ORF Transcript_1453/g.4054 Transcript_1453/m.4054 type:complete len:217 (+) Transcript_1453:2975-3625(+)